MMTTFAPRSEASAGRHHFVFYHYEPSMVAAVIFVVLFALSTTLHSFQLIRSRTWFMVPFVIGGIFETVGYIGRVLSATENPGPYGKIPYIIQALLLLVAPPLFAASIYMELGRIVLMVEGEAKLFIRRRWLTKLFVAGDVICFMLQAYGSSMQASHNADKIQIANYVVIGGLGMQISYFALFIIAATLFHLRLARDPTRLALERPWVKHMTSLYIVGVLILTRSIMRLIEFIQGYDGYIITHEAFLYCFDAVPMFLACVTMNIINPAEVAKFRREVKDGFEKGDYANVALDESIISHRGYRPQI